MKNFKKFIIAGVFTLFLAGCGSDSEQIHLFNWGYFLDPDLLQQFYEEYGIEVIPSYYSSNEEMHARLTSGIGTFDVLVPSDYMISRLINEELLRPLNWDNLPNATNVYQRLMGREFDLTNRYSVPYKWGTVGILYNTTMVDHTVNSWDSMFNPDYAGQILMYNSERDAFVVPLKRMGYSLNTTNADQINRARDMLIEQLPLVQAYVTDQVMALMPAGEAAMALVYSGDASWSIMANPDLNFVIPQEGSNLWINSLVIPANANNPEAAEKFINFLLRPDVAGQNTNWVGYTTANQTAIEGGYIDEALTSLPSFNITDADYDRLEVFIDLGADRELITNAFTQVLATQ